MGNNDENINQKLDLVIRDVNDIKVSQVRHESQQDHMNQILGKLTESVEYHIKRTDTLEELVSLYKSDSDTNLTKELEPIKSHINILKGITYAVTAVGAILMALHQMGILQRLF
jgi:hypothetical protein